MKALTRLFVAIIGCASITPALADLPISLHLARNADNTRTTNYENGDKPSSSCTPMSTDGFTETALGGGSGQGCKTASGTYAFSALGLDTISDAYIAYKDGGTDDVEIRGRVTDSMTGSDKPGAGAGGGLRESTSVNAWLFQCKSLQVGTNAVQCQYGENGVYTAVDCTASGTNRPIFWYVTRDKSTGDVKGFTSVDGVTKNECASTTRNMSAALGYFIVGSKSATASTQVTIDNAAVATTITAYTPGGGGGGGAPTLDSAIPDISGTQGDSVSLTFSSYFTGGTSYTVTGLPVGSGLSESSDGVLSGTLNATDVSNNPYSLILAALNASGSASDTISVTAASSTGDTFTIPDVGDNTATDYDCNVTGDWTGLGGTGRPVGGDTIAITQGTRGNLSFTNCRGQSGARIKFRKTVGATRLTINSTGTDGLLFENSRYLDIDFTVNYTGHSGQCRPTTTFSETPTDECGLLIQGSAQFGVKFRGEARDITVKGFHVNGGWVKTTPPNTAGIDTGLSPNDNDYCVTNSPGDTDGDGDVDLQDREFRSNITAGDFIIENVAKEAIYFGQNVPNNGKCSSGFDYARLRDITIRDFFIKKAGWDCANLKSAFAGTNLFENFVCQDIGGGVDGSGANSVCLSLFESQGTMKHGVCRRTSDPPGGASGLTCTANNAPATWGTLECAIENVWVSDTDGAGISCRKGSASAPRTCAIQNVTVTDTGSQCINVNSDVASGYVRDSIVANCGANNIATTAPVTESNNLECTGSACGFVDYTADGATPDASHEDYNLQSTSPARNAGTPANCPSDDVVGTVRPKGVRCDQGAYEYVE